MVTFLKSTAVLIIDKWRLMKTFLLLQATVLQARCLLFILGIMLFAVGISVASAREVSVGVYENHPKVFTETDGTFAGIFVDIIEDIARREGWSLRYVHGSWPQCLKRLESGAIDLMMDVAYSPERADKYDFCENDVICNWAQVYTRLGLDIEIITELDGLRLATLRNGIHFKRFEYLAKEFGIRHDLTLCDDYETVFLMLHEKKADAGIVNRIFGYVHKDKYDVVRSPVVFSPASLRFAVLKGSNTDIITAVDRHLAAMKTEKPSAYHQSLRRWLGETTKLRLPQWIFRSLAAAGIGILLLAVMSFLLKYQVSRKTAHLRLANAQLEEQVSETMRAHLELKRSEEKLIHQERLSALGQMTSGIAHDFNNMLTPILGYSDLILEDPDILKNCEELLSMLGSIRKASGEARETVKRLQEFQRADSRSKMEKVSVAELVSSVIAATKPLWKTHKEIYSTSITIREDVPLDLMVTASKSQLREALMNLLLNAIYALPSGGEVTIRAFVKDEYFYLEVRDTGIGMSKDVVQRCLEPFFSTKGEDGTGMGLAMVHGIIERHNGSLSIDSAPGKGTTIAMRLPLAQEETGAQPDPRASAKVVRPLKVLVVDDDMNSRKLLSKYLALDGHCVTTAIDVSGGIAEFDQGEFNLLITDRAMPGASGDKMAQHVKASAHQVPVLMITGFAKVMAPRNNHSMDVDCILGKPFTVRELRNAIEQAFRS